MFYEGKPGRDAFTFSLSGVRAIAGFAWVPAIADDRLNKIWDERLNRAPEDQLDITLEIENALARYFAPGHCRAG